MATLRPAANMCKPVYRIRRDPQHTDHNMNPDKNIAPDIGHRNLNQVPGKDHRQNEPQQAKSTAATFLNVLAQQGLRVRFPKGAQ